MFSQCLHPLFPDFSSNSAAASVSAARFFSLSCTVLSNDMAGLRRPQDVNHLILMTSKFPSNKCLWLRARGFYRVRVSDKKSEGQGRLGRREREEVRRRISATLIDRYRSPSPLAWKNTRSSMSTEINKRKPPDRSSPPLWFSRGLGVTFPHDNVVTKVTSHPTPTEGGWWRIGMEGKLFSPPTTPTPKESQGRLTESQQRIDQMTIVRLTFSEMHQEVKRCTSSPCSMPR